MHIAPVCTLHTSPGHPVCASPRNRLSPVIVMPSATTIVASARLRHDHGSNDLADDVQQEVAFFGIESSPSFVREPEGNGVAERFIRT